MRIGIVLVLLGALSLAEALLPFEVKPVISVPKPVIEPKPIEPAANIPVTHPDTEPIINPDTEPITEPDALVPDVPSGAQEPHGNSPEPNTPTPRLPAAHVGVSGIDGVEDYDWPSLGSYSDSEEAPFTDYEGEWDLYFSEVYDVFAAEKTYFPAVDLERIATGEGSPFKNGQPTGQRLQFTKTAQSPAARTVTITFDPNQPTDLCRLVASMGSYCGDGGTACACYSGTYYVPDQYNSLAAGCARLTARCPTYTGSTNQSSSNALCGFASAAARFTAFCPTSVDGLPTVAFAASVTASSNAIPTTATASAASITATPIITSTSSANVAGAVASGMSLQDSTGFSGPASRANLCAVWVTFVALILGFMFRTL